MKSIPLVLSLLAFAAMGGCSTAPQPASPKPAACQGKLSPNQKWCAEISSVGKHAPPLDENKVAIHDARNMNLLASKSFKSADGEHGRSVAKSAWTPDSRFFVFSTMSSGGHSPWHWPTYFYDRKKNKFKELDDTTGAIVKRNFHTRAPDEVDVYVQGIPSDPSDISTGTLKKIHLSTIP